MLYRDLVQFDPIETVIQLRGADRKDEARHLVRSYVISDRMADVLVDLVLPQLRFEQPADNKGILIVGNYGTGKSHLMSVISALAEHGDLVDDLGQARVAAAVCNGVAGRFQVLRTEVGTTRMALRDILFGHLEGFLVERGIEHHFPNMLETSNSKDPLIAMMARFGELFPEQGLLLVVDELLEYLLSRNEHELILDLNFLRELGEVCKLTRFRFIGGVQESLFDSPRFQFVANTVRRVRDRFDQVRITRSDVAFVVAERLLRKTPDQRAWIHRYLARFAPLYPAMAERMEDFVRLFPIHPVYLEVFERITVAEKREVLRTLSRGIAGRLDTAVPEDAPGIISYDEYWPVLQQDASLRSVPEIREVAEKSQVLEERIRAAYTRPAYRPLALRIIRGLSVLRLTTGDIYAPLGATPQELRDGLCLFIPQPEPDPDFLQTTIGVALKEIIRTVSGQFISANAENGQYYIDLKKDIDYDALINEKARGLSPEQLDRYYFDALRRVMECTDSTYVAGYRIWAHEIPWPGHGVTRSGYLFFGAPNERSTAQPPRDFYLYFIQPYEPPHYQDDLRPDEVFFQLVGRDEQFEQMLQAFAGAMEMALISSGEHKQTYQKKASDLIANLQRWLRQRMPQAVTVTHEGTSRRMAEWAREGAPMRSDLSILELVNGVASACLSSRFEECYGEYPSFRGMREPITDANRARMAQEAIRWLAGTRTQAGLAVLEGLGLIQDGQIRPRAARYALHILSQLEKLRPGEVLNRSALITTEYPGLERDPQFKLEPEWLIVVLLALVYSGDIVLQLPGDRVDASTLSAVQRLPLDTLIDFRFLERPRDLPLAAWVAVFELLDLTPGLVREPDRHDVAIDTLQRQVEAEIGRVLRVQEVLRQGLLLWQEPVLDTPKQAGASQALSDYKTFLESLRVFTTPGRLRNLRASEAEVRGRVAQRQQLRSLEKLSEAVFALQPLTSYLREAEAVLSADDTMLERIRRLRIDQLARLRAAPDWTDTPVRQSLQRELESLKGDYVEHYVGLHERARLGQLDDERKRRLLADRRLKGLRLLSGINLLPEEQLRRVTERLGALVSCWRLVPSDLRQGAVCPHCSYKPIAAGVTPNAAAELNRIEDDLDRLQAGWADALLAELGRPNVAANLELLDAEKRALLRALLETRELPESITETFVGAVNDALRGLERLSVPSEALLLALAGDGTPCAHDVFKKRFAKYVDDLLAEHDAGRVRITLDW